MPSRWHMHDAGLIQLEIPPGWSAHQPSAGTLLLEDRVASVSLSLMVVNKHRPADKPLSTHDAYAELQRWVATHRQLQIEIPARQITDARHLTATLEGQLPPRRLKWYRRLFQWRTRATSCRFWAILNDHVMVLVKATGRKAPLELCRETLDRLISSVDLPRREILTGRQFAEQVVSLARLWFPEMATSVIDDGHVQFGARQVGVERLYRRYLASPDELSTQVRALFTQLQKESAATRVPGWEEARTLVLPALVRRDALFREPDSIVQEEWINGLHLAFALEDPAGAESQHLVTAEDLSLWKVTAEDLQEQARQNLIARSHQQVMEGRQSEGFTLLTLARDDRHNAARILLPELHHKLSEHLGQTFYAAMPARNILRAFNTRDPQMLTRIRQEITREFAQAKNGLSPKLFLVTPDGIAGDPDT